MKHNILNNSKFSFGFCSLFFYAALLLFLVIVSSTNCFAGNKTGTLESEEEINDQYKLCVYSNGDVVKQRISSVCKYTHK